MRREQIGRKKAERAGRDRASALKAVPSRQLSALGLLSSGAVGVVVSHPLGMREGPGSIPGLSMPMCACVCHRLPIPGLSASGFAVRLAKGGCSAAAGCRTSLLNPIWKVESYRSAGRNQQEQLRVQRAGRPHSLRRSEREPKECAGSLLRRGRVPNVTFESNMPRFSRPHSFVHSEHQPKERAGSRKEEKRPNGRARTRLRTASTNQRSAPAAERKKKGKAGRAGRDRASALKTVPCRCFSAFPGRACLPTASTNQRVRRQQIGRKQAEWAGRDRASALKAVPSR